MDQPLPNKWWIETIMVEDLLRRQNIQLMDLLIKRKPPHKTVAKQSNTTAVKIKHGRSCFFKQGLNQWLNLKPMCARVHWLRARGSAKPLWKKRMAELIHQPEPCRHIRPSDWQETGRKCLIFFCYRFKLIGDRSSRGSSAVMHSLSMCVWTCMSPPFTDLVLTGKVQHCTI